MHKLAQTRSSFNLSLLGYFVCIFFLSFLFVCLLLMWAIFNFYWICYNIASVLCLVFDLEACGWDLILASQLGIKPVLPALENEVFKPLDHQGNPIASEKKAY